jgi:O-antigen ligase
MATALGDRSASAWSPRPLVGARAGLHVDQAALAVAIAICVATLVGMALGFNGLTLVAAGSALVAAVIAPPVGLLILAFLGPLKPPDVIPSPGFDLFLVGAILLGCVYRLPIDRPRIALPAPLLVLLAFFLYVTVQQLPEMLSGYAGEAAHRIGFLYIQLAALVGAAVAAGYILKDRRPGPYLAMSLSAACVAAYLAISMPGNQADAGPLAGLIAMTDDGTRAVGPFGNPNYFGHFLAAAVALAIAWAAITRERGRQWALVAVGFLIGYALTLSLSRGAIAALLAGILGLAFSRSRVLGVAVIVGGLAAVLIIYPAFIQWRLENLNGYASGSAYQALQASDSSRLDAVLAGPQLFLTAPLFGIGFGQYSELSSQFTSLHFAIGSHNWYMSVLAEQGVVGAALWVLLLATVAYKLWHRPAPARWVGFAVLGVFIAGSAFVTQPVSFQTAILPVIVITAALVADWSPPNTAADPRSVGDALATATGETA